MLQIKFFLIFSIVTVNLTNDLFLILINELVKKKKKK